MDSASSMQPMTDPYKEAKRLADTVAMEITLTLTPSHLEAVLNCLDACASDEREPERYRSWYAEAAAEIRAQSDGTVSG